ncbi:hypothetical protein [Fundicoccus ignavus]|uniref:Uncharacterized protein n=1 Tax=Fundicoccus ignavus TaxID=2664442 RepID=A0A844BXZ7_9LACT|nr:hypothetical protein [Fundicoccus ignavus]MRJ46898.1 hypothetical protein [Fundicoccus ignavus]
MDRRIYVIDLAIKPEDLFSERQFNKHKEMFSYKSLRSTRKSYLYWYPLILGSSYIRRDKKDYFASEYIIPQFFMHWLHSRDNTETSSVGVRYFSCASIRASKFGYNYAFITSGENISNEVCYCNKLNSVFKWTKPKYMMEFESIESLQDTLKNDSNIQNLNDETFT